ncbi:MAG: hypothetical protein WCS56_05870, partial [Bacilli bacterium]
MYPDVIIYKKNLKIERLKTQGLSTYEVNTDQLYVLYSIYLDIKLGDIIYLNLSEIKINWSMIYWSHQQEKQIIKSKKIYKQL